LQLYAAIFDDKVSLNYQYVMIIHA
jgi:hypothetical protein